MINVDGEWLDAYFEQRKDGMYVLTQNKTRAEKLEDCLMQNKTPRIEIEIDLDYWLSNPTKQGLPRENTSKGSLYYWHPRDKYVARFDADSDRADLDYDLELAEDFDSHTGTLGMEYKF